MRFLGDGQAAMSANQWREFWRSRGMLELREVVAGTWSPFGRGAEAGEARLFRIASLLGSRASRTALADELGRIRRELGDEAAPPEDARAAHAIARWFEEVTR